jgi:hypothetical protein
VRSEREDHEVTLPPPLPLLFCGRSEQARDPALMWQKRAESRRSKKFARRRRGCCYPSLMGSLEEEGAAAVAALKERAESQPDARPQSSLGVARALTRYAGPPCPPQWGGSLQGSEAP